MKALRPRRESGLTLVEMLAVLFILALVAGMAVTATEGLIDKSRQESTVQSLRELQEAIVGPKAWKLPDGSPWLSGYVADIGGPLKAFGSDPALQLQDLWLSPAGAEYTSTGDFMTGFLYRDTTIRMAGGWRGPYVHLPLGFTQPRDGWSNFFRAYDSGGLTPDPGEDIASIDSSQLAGQPVSVAGKGNVSVTVKPHLAGPDRLVTILYHITYVPAETTPNKMRVTTVLPLQIDHQTPSGDISQAARTWSPGVNESFTFRSIPLGFHVVRAYQFSSGSPPAAGDDLNGLMTKTETVAVPVVRSAPPSIPVIEFTP